MALARLAALRQQAARAQTGLTALSASATLSLGQRSLDQPCDGPCLRVASSTECYQQRHTHTPASSATQPLKYTASQPPYAHGYVASAQPEPIEEDHEVRGLLMSCMLAGCLGHQIRHTAIAVHGLVPVL